LKIVYILFLVIIIISLPLAICKLPIIGGNCKEKLEKFAYVSGSYGENQCALFLYSGCKGNENNFATLKECEDKCKE
ncbi:hypothetical protein KR018_010044, partial [Drosophila ironensis]